MVDIAWGLWTLKVKPDVAAWTQKKHGETHYYMKQLLSAHGYFQKYLHRTGKTNKPLCTRCNSKIPIRFVYLSVMLYFFMTFGCREAEISR